MICLKKKIRCLPPFVKFHGMQTSTFPSYILLVIWSNFLSACYLLLTLSFLFAHLNLMQLYISQHMLMKQQKKCCFQSPNLIFGAFRYLTDITMFLCLKRKAVNIRALWVVAALDICRMCQHAHLSFCWLNCFTHTQSTAKRYVTVIFPFQMNSLDL